MVYVLTDEVVELDLMALSFDALIDGLLGFRSKRMQITAKILDEWNTNEQDEMVDLALEAHELRRINQFCIELGKNEDAKWSPFS